MQKANVKVFIIIIIAILLGVAMHFADPLDSIVLLIIGLVAAFFSFAVIVIGLFSKKFRFWYLIGFLPFLVEKPVKLTQ